MSEISDVDRLRKIIDGWMPTASDNTPRKISDADRRLMIIDRWVSTAGDMLDYHESWTEQHWDDFGSLSAWAMNEVNLSRRDLDTMPLAEFFNKSARLQSQTWLINTVMRAIGVLSETAKTIRAESALPNSVERSREIRCTQTDVWTFVGGKGRGRGKVIERLKEIKSYRKEGTQYLVVLSNPADDKPFQEHIEKRKDADNRGRTWKTVEDRGITWKK
jgi:hypothetical protein